MIVRSPLTVDEAFDIYPPFNVESPVTVNDPRVPSDVRDELTTVEPRVVAERIEALLIK